MADYNALANDPQLLNLGNVVSFGALANDPQLLNLGNVVSFGALANDPQQYSHFGLLGSRVPGIVKRTLYRGKVGINYLYAVDTPPPGATNVIIVGYTYDE